MKNTLTIVIVLWMAVCLAGCDDETGGNKEIYQPLDLTATEAELSSAMTEASIDLLKEVDQQMDANSNYVFSPFSAIRSVTELINGADNYTRSKVLNRLGGKNIEECNNYQKRLTDYLESVDRRSKVMMADGLWTMEKVNNAYAEETKKYFGLQLGRLTDNPDENIRMLNEWVSEATEGLIPSFKTEGNTSFSLINTLYFKGTWRDESTPGRGKFHNSDGTEVKIDNFKLENLICCETFDFTSVTAFYGNGAYRMTIILPEGDKTPGAVISSLTTDQMKLWYNCPEGFIQGVKYWGDAHAEIPEWETSSFLKMEHALSDAGFGAIFADDADFTAIVPSGVIINKVEQCVRIRTDRKGTEAAAATEIGGLTAPYIRTITIDRPFAYFITEASTGTILFAGVVNKL